MSKEVGRSEVSSHRDVSLKCRGKTYMDARMTGLEGAVHL
jgi:hypothetical protein